MRRPLPAEGRRHKFEPSQATRLPTDLRYIDVRWLGSLMPIYQLLHKQDRFAPEEIAMLGKIFEEILPAMGLIDRKDLVTTIVAETMIEWANAGVRDPERLKQLTVQAFEKD
jgi:hypothetical protein